MKNVLFVVTAIFCVLVSVESVVAQTQLKTVRFEELSELQRSESRPVFIFFTAEWCRYCKNVEHTSFRDPEIVEQLNEAFYVVIFDIETKEPITFGAEEYRFKSTGLNTGVHELAEELGTIDGVVNTPTFVVMDAEMNLLFQYGGYMDSEQILKLIKALNS